MPDSAPFAGFLALARAAGVAIGGGAAARPLAPVADPAPRAVTVGDLMGLRSISDVRISPDGRQVAYVVSRPSLEKDEHEAVLYLVSAAGGAAPTLKHAPPGPPPGVVAGRHSPRVPGVRRRPAAGLRPRRARRRGAGLD